MKSSPARKIRPTLRRGPVPWKKVFRLSGLTLEMRVGGRTVTTTEKHPFFVVSKGWVWAAKLQRGDMLLGHDGRANAVESVTPTNRHESLYNLRVAVDRTYFVGSRDWGFSLWRITITRSSRSAAGIR